MKSIGRFIYWLIVIALALFLVAFVVSNNTPVSLSLWPLPIQFQASLALLVVCVLISGIIIGGLLTWFSGFRHRLRARSAEKEAKKNKKRADELEEKLKKTTDEMAIKTLALTHKKS